MLIHAVETYLSVRQATGFHLKEVGHRLRSFAAYSNAKGQNYVNCNTAIEWARQASSVEQRARRLGDVIRLARYLRAEDARMRSRPLSSVVSAACDGPLISSLRSKLAVSFS